MSSVYRARDRVLERQVAVKLLHEQYAGDEDAVERFRREATSVAQLAHTNVVTVIDRGEDGRRQFIVFELVDGPNLKEVVRARGPLPVAEALGYGIQAGRALGFAHAQGLVHRDVKPQNILVAADAHVKVTDFGIARALELDGLTRTGTVLGTSEYVAPEQARGELVGPPTDIYALGVVLFELLAGEPPYTGDSFVEIALRHVNDPVPSVRARRPDVPWRVDTAIARALAKNPADRFASMDALVAEREGCVAELAGTGPAGDSLTTAASALDGETREVPALDGDGSSAAARRPGRRKRSIWPLAFGLGGLAVAAAVAVTFAIRNADDGGGSGGGTPAVVLRGVATYDPPPGDGVEHDEEVALATDGNASTAWSTERYGAALEVLGKKGVGLVVDAGAPAELAQVAVRTDTPGFRAQLLAGAAPGGPFEAVTEEQEVTPRTVFEPAAGTSARYIVVWITRLAGESARITEVELPQP